MLQRLQAAIDNGDLQVINMHKDGDGPQILELFTRPGEKVLRELIGDLRLASHQHFAFHEYKDPHGNRLFAGDANGSVSFQLAQIKIGNDKVPVSIVLYIDGTFLKKGTPIRPVYHKCIYIIPDIMPDVIADIIPDITYVLSRQSVVSIMTDLCCPSRHGMHGVHWHF